ncbi:MAG: hypothetical protein WCK11_00145 [Candidatus Falkowbacteria bacterium]
MPNPKISEQAGEQNHFETPSQPEESTIQKEFPLGKELKFSEGEWSLVAAMAEAKPNALFEATKKFHDVEQLLKDDFIRDKIASELHVDKKNDPELELLRLAVLLEISKNDLPNKIIELLDDETEREVGLTVDELAALEAKGYQKKFTTTFNRKQAVELWHEESLKRFTTSGFSSTLSKLIESGLKTEAVDEITHHGKLVTKTLVNLITDGRLTGRHLDRQQQNLRKLSTQKNPVQGQEYLAIIEAEITDGTIDKEVGEQWLRLEQNRLARLSANMNQNEAEN